MSFFLIFFFFFCEIRFHFRCECPVGIVLLASGGVSQNHIFGAVMPAKMILPSKVRSVCLPSATLARK